MSAQWSCVATLCTPMPVNCLLPPSLSQYNDDVSTSAHPSCPPTGQASSSSPWTEYDDCLLLRYGMYQHNGDQQERSGAIRTWNWGLSLKHTSSERGSTVSGTTAVGDAAFTDASNFPGVFDMISLPPSPRGGGGLLGAEVLVSCTDGTVRGLSNPSSSSSSGADERWRVQVDTEMITSTSFLGGGGGGGGLVCSAHLGKLSHVVHDTTGGLVLSSSWDGHEFDAWCTASAAADTAETSSSSFWSGGDDGMLHLWDVRAGGDSNNISSSLKRRFDAGVVTVVVAAVAGLGDHELIVGSYDDHLYVLDRRSLKRSIAELNVGGGAWRCRLASTKNKGKKERQYVVAAMHGGARMVEWSPATSSLSLVQQTPGSNDDEEPAPPLHGVDDHVPAESRTVVEGVLVYDAVYLNDDTIATCSFYNQTIKIWQRGVGGGV